MKKNHLFLSYFILIFLAACSSKNQVDLIVHNANIYTVDAKFSKAEAFAVQNGKFVAIGNSKEILAQYSAAQIIDAKGKAVYPGFYDAHCHFYGYGNFLQEVDLTGTKSFDEILERLQAFRKANPERKWLIGRGWDQNDWTNKEFPEKSSLDSIFKDTPVFLVRVDGHAALANKKALDLANITESTPALVGGLIEKKDGRLTGILVDNAVDLVSKAIPSPTEDEIEKILLDAQSQCFAVGLTSVGDAGLERKIIEAIDKLHKTDKLKMRIYAMLSSDEATMNYYLEKGKYKTDFLNVCSFKVYADGALGSRGASLLAPYSDKKEIGFLLETPQKLEEKIKRIAAKDFQVNTHCIGDSANRLILNLYGQLLKGKNDKRWRIEHAQVVDKADIAKFGQFNILPSVQPTHATSDMYWAEARLGKERVKNAYAFKDLFEQNKMIPFGSDFPVEHINPLYGFHAAVARQDANNFPANGFQIENAVSRETALRAMTIWAAFAAFEEKEKGSIEQGKFADFVILEEDIMQVSKEKLRKLKVTHTIVNGKIVYEKKNVTE